MEWRPAGWSVCLPLLIFPCTMKSRSSLLALAHPGGPGKRAVKWLWCCVVVEDRLFQQAGHASCRPASTVTALGERGALTPSVTDYHLAHLTPDGRYAPFMLALDTSSMIIY